jgi:RNA polymerase sigma-70 factor (ECF subfamily)
LTRATDPSPAGHSLIGSMPASAQTVPPSDEHQRFAAIYREHVDFVWRSLRRMGTPDSMLEDATQDVFLVAARRLGEFEGRSSIKTWLFGIAMRVVKTHRRSRWRHERKLEALTHAADAPASDPIAQRDAQRTLLLLLEQLDDDRKAVYVLAELEGLTAVEIAEGLGVNVNTVYTRLRTARLALREAAERLSRDTGEPT